MSKTEKMKMRLDIVLSESVDDECVRRALEELFVMLGLDSFEQDGVNYRVIMKP